MQRAVAGVTKEGVSMVQFQVQFAQVIQLTFRLVLCHDTVHENNLRERDSG